MKRRETLSAPTQFPKSRLIAAAQLNAGFSLIKWDSIPRALSSSTRRPPIRSKPSVCRLLAGTFVQGAGDTAGAAQDLKATYEADPQSPVAEKTRFFIGPTVSSSPLTTERPRGCSSSWREMAEGRLRRRQPAFCRRGRLFAGSVDEAAALVRRFQSEYAKSPLALHEEILEARVLDARAVALSKQSAANGDKNGPRADELRREAISHLEKVAAASRIPRTVNLARFHLGRILQEAGQNAPCRRGVGVSCQSGRTNRNPPRRRSSLSSSGPAARVNWAKSSPRSTPFQNTCRFDRKEDRRSRHSPAAPWPTPGWAKTGSAADALRLFKEFPADSVGAATLRRLAERAYDAKEWSAAADLFAAMAEQGAAHSELRQSGLSGLGWSRFKMNSFDQSAVAFGQVFEQFPLTHDQVAEAGYMRGRALTEAGKPDEAAKAFAEAFKKLCAGSFPRIERVPRVPSDRLRSAEPPQYAFLAGVQAASILAQLKRYDDSDAAYRAVVERFPAARDLGQVLFDWANMLYVARKDADQSAARERFCADCQGISGEPRSEQGAPIPGRARSCRRQSQRRRKGLPPGAGRSQGGRESPRRRAFPPRRRGGRQGRLAERQRAGPESSSASSPRAVIWGSYN